MKKVRYMSINCLPNVQEDKAGRIFKIGNSTKRFKLRVRYYDEHGSSCIQPKAKVAQIMSVNGFAFNDQERVFESRKEIKETAYMFMYNMYNIADGIAIQ